VFAIIFGLAGRTRARTVGRGRRMATTGLVLGLLWLAVQAGVLALGVRDGFGSLVGGQPVNASMTMDPGCAAVERSGAVATMQADARAGNTRKLVTDLRALAAQVTTAQTATRRAVAAAAMTQFAADLNGYASSLSKGQPFTPAEVNQFVADAGAVDRACALGS
jgi:hypothetical protein